MRIPQKFLEFRWRMQEKDVPQKYFVGHTVRNYVVGKKKAPERRGGRLPKTNFYFLTFIGPLIIVLAVLSFILTLLTPNLSFEASIVTDFSIHPSFLN